MDIALNDFEVNKQIIEKLRTHLNSMIIECDYDTLHPDVIQFSQLLGHFITVYTKDTMKNN